MGSQHHARYLAGGHALQRVAAAELDQLGHAGALGIALGKVHHAVRHIAAVHDGALLGGGAHFVGACLGPDGAPDMGLKRQVLLESKATLRTGGNVAGNLRRLDGDGAAASAKPFMPLLASFTR